MGQQSGEPGVRVHARRPRGHREHQTGLPGGRRSFPGLQGTSCVSPPEAPSSQETPKPPQPLRVRQRSAPQSSASRGPLKYRCCGSQEKRDHGGCRASHLAA